MLFFDERNTKMSAPPPAKLADSFEALSLKIGVKPEHLDEALEKANELGLMPSGEYTRQEGRFIFQVEIPCSSWTQNPNKVARLIHPKAVVYYGAIIRLPCPVKA